MSKYIQSFYAYPVTFSSIGKGIPSKDADGDLRNIAEVSDEELDILQNREPFFRKLVDTKKYRVLNKLPESYKPAALLVNEANERAAKAEAELAALKAEKENKGPVELEDMDYKDLQKMAADKGIEYKNVKKAELIQALKDAE